MTKTKMHFRKDASLDQLAEAINVAQFVSYSPEGPKQEYSRVLGHEPNHIFGSVTEAVARLMERSPESSLNVRSFLPDDPRSHEFIYGLSTVSDVCDAISRITSSGFYVIVNETVDINDGGVSGVIQGGLLEFAPDDTPRCVEKPGVAAIPASWGLPLLERVYGFPIHFNVGINSRLEFSIHPKPRGWKHTHVLGWELELLMAAPGITVPTRWPNRFSRLLGDKAYGLLVAWALGLPVPLTTVIGRRLAPFTFGEKTASPEWWIRTCPTEQVPGKFTTHHGWLDPFKLLSAEDISGDQISSVIAQAAVPAQFSGALIINRAGAVHIEGVRGEGEQLMKGEAFPEVLPEKIVSSVEELFRGVQAKLGAVRFEWVHDGVRPWLVQLHCGATESDADTLVPGDARIWRKFAVSHGLEALRRELATLQSDEGIVLLGQVGLTSHVADVVRRTGRPARISTHL